MKPRFFKDPASFRTWLEKDHLTRDEVIVGFYKRETGKPSITWPESVDQALCFGWIDGIRRKRDDQSYTIRFTPRRHGSIWSAVNIRRVEELTRQGLMRPAGLAAFARRTEEKSRTYSYEHRHAAAFEPEHLKRLQANADAWSSFQNQPPWYRRQATYWVISAKQPETRLRRLDTLIQRLAKGQRV